MRALVTGATGFLGTSLVRQLLAGGHDVRCLVRPSSDVAGLHRAAAEDGVARLEIHAGNLGRLGSCREAAEGCDVVYHVAACMRGATAVLFLNNVVATRTLIEAALGAGVPRFVLVSSLAVYGTGHLRKGETLDERAPLDPAPHLRDPYTYSKVAQEKAAWQARTEQGLGLAVIRPGVIYGPGRDCLTARVGLRLGGLLLRMGGRQPLPYTFVDNCAAAVLRAGTVAAAEGGAFNIVDDDPPTGRELLRAYRAAVGRVRAFPVPGWAVGPLSGLCEWYHRWSRGQLPAVLTRYKSDAMWKPLRYGNARAKEVLGWSPAVDFPTGLERTFASLRERARQRQAVPA
jgi:nucleoside-diphosphate-sugar epimerase